MKLPAASAWATHLLALLAGVGIVQMMRMRGPAGGAAGMAEVGGSVSRDPGKAEVVRRLEASREEERKRRSSAEEAPDETAPREPTQTMAQMQLSWRSDEVERDREKLNLLLKRAGDFRKVDDLRGPLMEALLLETGGDETVEAIFIEWYRRDPAAAMNELAARPVWSRTILGEGALVLHLTPEVLLNESGARNRSASYRTMIIEGLARYWLARDDLRGLSAGYDKLGGFQKENLMSYFLSRQWVPRDGAADLAFVANGMSEPCRKAFLTRLACARPDEPSLEWSQGMAASLLKQTLGEEQVAAYRKKAEEAPRGPFGGCGGGEDEFIGLPDHERVAMWMKEITADNESESLSSVLGRLLEHDRDYRELFGSGKVTGEEIFENLLPQIPGGKDHEAGLRRALYQDLASWNPKAAVEWASGYLTEAELQSVALKTYETYNDPRTSRELDLLEELPLKFEDGRYVGKLPAAFYDHLEDWKILDPEAAAAAMARNPKTMELAEKLREKPADYESPSTDKTEPDAAEETSTEGAGK